MLDPEAATGGNAKQGLLSWLENLVKLSAAGLGLVAAIGLPAVAIQLVRFGAPVSTATYNDVIRAGVLPAVVLALVASYCIAAGRALTRMGWHAFVGLHSLLLSPLLIPAYVVLFLGMFANLLILGWVLLVPIRLLVGGVSGIDITNRQLLIASALLFVPVTIAVVVLRRTEARWANRPGRFWRLLRRILRVRQGRVSPAASNEQRQEKKALHAGVGARERESKWEGAMTLIFLPTSLLMMYSIKWLLHIWDPRLGELLPHRYVVLASAICGVVMALFLAGMLLTASTSSEKKATPRHKRTVIVVAVAVYITFEATYSLWGYPRLPAGLGGGRPQPATVWLKHEDDAKDFVMVLQDAEVTDAGTLKRVDRVFVVLDTDQDILLTDTPVGPGKTLLLRKSRLMALSWP